MIDPSMTENRKEFDSRIVGISETSLLLGGTGFVEHVRKGAKRNKTNPKTGRASTISLIHCVVSQCQAPRI